MSRLIAMDDRPFVLPDGYLQRIVNELTDARTIGFLLSGSHARGEATPHSDVDLTKFVTEVPSNSRDRLIVTMDEGHLLCVTLASVEAKLDELRQPDTAIWAVPGIRQAQILSDTDGAIAKLKLAAASFNWTDLQPAADLLASRELASLAEEVRKVINAWHQKNESASEYAIIGLLLGLTKTVAIRLGVMVESENIYFELVRQAVGADSDWSSRHRITCTGPSLHDRTLAALGLYLDTARLIGDVPDPADAAVIRSSVESIGALLGDVR